MKKMGFEIVEDGITGILQCQFGYSMGATGLHDMGVVVVVVVVVVVGSHCS